jgi:hypothetical protein
MIIEQETSVKTRKTETIRSAPEKDRQYADSMRRFLQPIRNAPDRSTQGKLSWTRDELHQR